MADITDPAARTEEDREFAAISEADIWAEARDRLKICTDAEADNRKRAKEAIEFREGKQWGNEVSTSVSQENIELTINLTDALVTRVENNIKQQRPRSKVHPVGDGADVAVAEVLNGIIRHVEARSSASYAYDTAASCATVGGFGYFRLITEYVTPRSFQKDFRILPIPNAFSVSMDMSALMPDGRDQNWCIISVKMKRQEYRRRWPNDEMVPWNDVSRDELRLDWENKEDIRLAEYFRIREKEEKLYLIRGNGGEEFTKYRSELPRNPETNRIMTLDELAPFLAERGLRIEGDRESTKKQVEWFRLNGVKVKERQQLPGEYIPVFRVQNRATDIDGRIRRRGMVESMQDPARMVNYGEVAKIKRLGLAPKAPWVAAEGQTEDHPEWTTSNISNHPVLTYKPVTVATSQGDILLPPPMRQPPAQIEQGFAEFVQGMRSNLMAVAGMPNEPGQDERGVVLSGRALEKRQYLSDQSHFNIYDNLTMAIEQCSRVITSWAPYYLSEPGRIQRIIGEDSTPTTVMLNEATEDEGIKRVKNDLTIGTYDVVMDTGPGYETKREEGAENFIELMKIGQLAEIIAKQAPDLVFRAIDHPYMQELADRLMAATPDGLKKVMEGLSSQAKSLVQFLFTENTTLKQQLQQLQADMKVGLTKTHMRETIEAHNIAETNKTRRFDTLVKAQTARDLEEIKAGYKLIDSGQARGHDAEMAETQMLHAAREAGLDRQFQQSTAYAETMAKQFDKNQQGQTNDNSNAGQQ